MHNAPLTHEEAVRRAKALAPLHTCARYVHEQGITSREVAIEDMFAATTLKAMKI